MRKFNFGKLEQVGHGGEKSVFAHPDDPNKLVADIRKWTTHEGETRGETPNQMKGRYYLTKIMHMLMPKNIPDVHFSEAGDRNTLVIERKRLDEQHEAVRDLIVRYRVGGEEDVHEVLKAAVKKQSNQMASDHRCRDIVYKLRELGLSIDNADINFGFDAEGNIVYVESFKPWPTWSDGEVGDPNFSKDELSRLVSKLPVGQKKTAISYLKRLDTLYENEVREFAKRRAEKDQAV